jgi:hypothetical protein
MSILHHRFVVGGYVRKRVTLPISKGLRAIALAAGISRRVYSDTRVIFITIIAIYIALAEKIGTPLISRWMEGSIQLSKPRIFVYDDPWWIPVDLSNLVGKVYNLYRV